MFQPIIITASPAGQNPPTTASINKTIRDYWKLSNNQEKRFPLAFWMFNDLYAKNANNDVSIVVTELAKFEFVVKLESYNPVAYSMPLPNKTAVFIVPHHVYLSAFYDSLKDPFVNNNIFALRIFENTQQRLSIFLNFATCPLNSAFLAGPGSGGSGIPIK
jgi:hypothetical protein